MSWVSGICPICLAKCGEALPRVGDQREISCASCGRYRITALAEKGFHNTAEPARRAVLRQATIVAARSTDVPLIASHLQNG